MLASTNTADLPEEVDDFEILEQVGCGAFSKVHIARHKPTGCYVAAKIVELQHLKPHEFNGIMGEISVFMQVQHPNVCSFYRISQHENLLIFFIEFASGGTLLNYVNKHGPLDEVEARRIFIQAYGAIQYLHLHYFLVHRDLKLENILLDSDNNVKITDFGLSATFYCNTLRSYVGTPGYTPPEIIAGNEYNEKCDVWSLGICLYSMLTGQLPFTTNNTNHRKLVEEAENFLYPPTFSPVLVDLLRQMLEVRPSYRPNLMELQDHPWLKGLPRLSMNITPVPIVFYQVNSASDIKRFKRKPFQPEEAILEKCGALGIDTENLSKCLLDGVINADTTTYFAFLHPLYQKPEITHSKPHTVKKQQELNKSKSTPVDLGQMGVAPAKEVSRNLLRKRSPGMYRAIPRKP